MGITSVGPRNMLETVIFVKRLYATLLRKQVVTRKKKSLNLHFSATPRFSDRELFRMSGHETRSPDVNNQKKEMESSYFQE